MSINEYIYIMEGTLRICVFQGGTQALPATFTSGSLPQNWAYTTI